MQLTEQFHIPDDHTAACDRLTTLVKGHAGRLLAQEYWTETHIQGVASHTEQSHIYIRDDEHDAFESALKNTYIVGSNGASTNA